MNKRALLRALGAAVAAAALGGHTPYRQWTVYRKKHLLIGCHKQGPATYDLARQVVTVLHHHLPDAQARVARAPTPGRIASLLGTDQLDVCVLGWRHAGLVLAGQEEFLPYGPIPMLLIAPLGAHALVAHERLPVRHAWLLADALAGSPLVEPALPADGQRLAWHPGAESFRNGEPDPRDAQ